MHIHAWIVDASGRKKRKERRWELMEGKKKDSLTNVITGGNHKDPLLQKTLNMASMWCFGVGKCATFNTEKVTGFYRRVQRAKFRKFSANIGAKLY